MEELVEPCNRPALDLDHVVTHDGNIYRVVGNVESKTYFLGYNVYSPDVKGDRNYRGKPYRKNLIEDDQLPDDALDMYKPVPLADIAELHDPIQAAIWNASTFRSTIWHDLYAELVHLVGRDSVGIFGSSMFGLHLTPEGNIRKDVDFVIQGFGNIEVLRRELPRIRQKLGFTAVSTQRQLRQAERYRNVFRNPNNSIGSIVARRWTGLQLSERVVTTIRLRDPALTTPIEVMARPTQTRSVIISGHVTDADSSNLFPRKFRLFVAGRRVDIYIMWWKFSTPVRDGDSVTLCGSMIPTKSGSVLRLTNYSQHWLKIDDPTVHLERKQSHD